MSNTKQVKDVQAGEHVLYKLKWYSVVGYNLGKQKLTLRDKAGNATYHRLVPKASVHVKAPHEQDMHPVA